MQDKQKIRDQIEQKIAQNKDTRNSYELSDEEYAEFENLPFDELIKRGICPECLHGLENGLCQLHGTVEQINMHYNPKKSTRYQDKYEVHENLESDNCSEWHFSTFETLMLGTEDITYLEILLECLMSSRVLSESEIQELTQMINKRIESV